MAGLVLTVALLTVGWRSRRRSRREAGAALQEDLGQELQEMIEDGQSCLSRAENLQGLAGRIEQAGGGGVEQGRICIGESLLQGRGSGVEESD